MATDRVKIGCGTKKRITRADARAFGMAELECGEVIQTGQASRALSTARLRRSPGFHLLPINVVVFHGPSAALKQREDSSWAGLPT